MPAFFGVVPLESRGPGREESVLKKTKKGWVVLSPRTGKKLGGPYKTKKQAQKRLRQVEYYKRKKKQAREARRAQAVYLGTFTSTVD